MATGTKYLISLRFANAPGFYQEFSPLGSGNFARGNGVHDLMRKLLKIGLALCLVYLFLSAIAGMVLAEASLKLMRRPLRHRQEIAEFVRGHYGAELTDVSISAADGVTLRAWYVRPHEFNGSTVVLLHGITDNREGVAGYGKMFLDHRYAVLLPDARRHGESGGDLATYGLKESDDIRRWIDWLYSLPPIAQQQRMPGDIASTQCVYGFGESYGAALMLQSL